MARKTQMTAFARFFLVMIVVAPLAYMGASYYNNEDGFQNLKDLFSGKFPSVQSEQVEEQTTTKEDIIISKPIETVPENAKPSVPIASEELTKLKDDLKYKDRRIEELYQEIEGLKIELKTKNDALEENAAKMEKIQAQLDLIKKAAGGK